MLRVLAMLVLHVASTLQMICRRTRVNATRATPTGLPKAKTDTQHQEPTPAAQHRSPPTSAHAEQRIEDARPSKHERVLTTVSHDHIWKRSFSSAFPAKAGIQTHDQKSAQSALSGLPHARETRLLNQLAPNKNAAA